MRTKLQFGEEQLIVLGPLISQMVYHLKLFTDFLVNLGLTIDSYLIYRKNHSCFLIPKAKKKNTPI